MFRLISWTESTSVFLGDCDRLVVLLGEADNLYDFARDEPTMTGVLCEDFREEPATELYDPPLAMLDA